MKPEHALYDNPRLAAGYAFARPTVHPHILRRVRERLPLYAVAERALDIGCGAGRSTAALDGVATRVVGIDPAAGMLAHRRLVAPRAWFIVGRAERLPFADGAFDLITAAGSINYTDRSLSLAEVARILRREGTFVIYDFSAGRRLASSGLLEEWYSEFERRYPGASGYEMDVRQLPYSRAGLVLQDYVEVEVPLPMTLDSYLRYVMSETRVELARSAGTPEADVREWCRLTLEAIFDDEPREVIFEGYAACLKRGEAAI